MNKRILSLATAAGVFLTSCSTPIYALNTQTSSDVKAEIEKQTELRDACHEMAEAARAIGVNEDDYIIWYAQQEWWKYQKTIDKLNITYKELLEKEQIKGSYLGNFRISFYCPCATCNGTSSGLTASGNKLTPRVSAAVDPSIIPLGSEIYVEGFGTLVAHDTGGAIKGNRIDICVSSHSEAYALGIQYKDVYLKS